MFEPREDVLAQLERLWEQGLILQAWELAKEHGPMERWAPGPALLVAARIASTAGNSKLANVFDILNWRDDRQDPGRYFQALFPRLKWRPPVLLLPEIQAMLEQRTRPMEDTDRADLLSFKSWALGTLRDFAAAHEAADEAIRLVPSSPWIRVQRSSVLEMEDRYEEALAAAREGMRIRKFHRPSVLQTVDCLVHLGRDDEAIQLLHEAHDATELGAFAMQLQALYSEREDHERGLWCLDEAERRMPLITKDLTKWIAGRRADFHYLADDIDACLEWCDRKGEGFQKFMAEKLRRPDARTRKRKRLNVPFIRQHNMTCAPATLASLAKYWGKDHDHLAIADAICYNGTPWHKEHGWAETHGFTVREFRFTREVLIALIDRGLPFTLTTSYVTSAHLQACIGYDDRSDMVLLRDPTNRHYGEMLIDGLIEAHPTQGPRCMVLVPQEEAHRLDGILFPDEAVYDAHHHLSVATEHHDRWKAEEAVSTLRAISPEHPLTLLGEVELAAYLGHRARQLEFTDRLIARFPNHAPLQLNRLGVLQMLGDREASKVLLETITAKPCDPIFISELGEWLLEDARQLAPARRYLRRAVLRKQQDGQPLENLAKWHIKRGEFEEAARLRRYASNLSSAWEPYARSYFDSCRIIGRIEDGLEFLRQRTKHQGRSDSAPWLTLSGALESLQRASEARAVLEEAMTVFPEDGTLKLEAGQMMVRWGDAERAVGLQWIEEARGKVADSQWRRHRARTALYLGDRPLAIRQWQGVLEREPLAIDAWQTLARLIAEEQGETEALAFVKAGVARHPRHTGLLTLLAQWQSAPEDPLPTLDRLLELDPDDNWARRERASARFRLGDQEGGLADAREALSRNEREPASLGVLADLLHRHGEQEEAVACLRRALMLDIDYTFAIDRLMEWCPDPAAQQESIAFVAEEMKRQVSNGECVPVFQRCAWGVLAPPDLMARLQGFCKERPDLWQTWIARLSQALQMDLPGEAAICSDHLATAFPLLPRTWLEVAKVRHAAGDVAGEVEAQRKALELAPAWDTAARSLSESLERLGRHDEAEDVLRSAVRHEPLNAMNHGVLAELLLRRGKKEEAWQSLLNAVDAAPTYAWAWSALTHSSTGLGKEQELRDLVERQNVTHSHSASWWGIAVDILRTLKDREKALETARAGLALHPKATQLRDQVPVLLCDLGRYDEALQACEAAPGETESPFEVAGRRAWVMMEMGDGPAAIRAMEAVLERQPDYAWGWQLLSEWHHARKNWKALEDSTKQWTRFSPDNSIAHGFAGLAAEQLEKPDQAKRAFNRAFLLDPTYEFAGRKLIYLRIRSGELNAARETLQMLRHYSPGPWVECDAILIALADKRDSMALEMGEKLCREIDEAGPLMWLNQEFTNHKLGVKWQNLLDRMVTEGGDLSPAVLAAWASPFSGKEALEKAAKRLRKFKIPEPARNAAWDVLLHSAPRNRLPSLARTWIRKERARFHADPELWNAVGEVLVAIDDFKAGAQWLGDWKDRGDAVGAHTLVNLTSAIDAMEGPAASAPIRESGITRFRNDRNSLALRAAHASYLASIARVDEADELLGPIEEGRTSQYYNGLAELGRAMVAATRTKTSTAETHYRNAIRQLGTWPDDPAATNHIRAAQKALASQIPGLKGNPRKVIKMWGGARKSSKAKSALFKVAIVLLAIAAIVIAVVSGSPILIIGVLIGLARGIGSQQK
ncbi:C39 family peptidase [Luteolibacter ambystomatis]|uniref:C39 family peptidase n=1 Tax=Luteolibacter ambystomatis TaxID=2824561 RepID=A0A975IYD1_9BACT|nr:tetratricopeptide repeat protein [Luteolibacter ambystomatis]QUE50266.1 C39 family peptidase [Luteolibacter ambystomatis]